MATSPLIVTEPCAGAVATAMAVWTPLIDPERSIAVPALPYGTATPVLLVTLGAGGTATVRLTVADAEVPPGPVAV